MSLKAVYMTPQVHYSCLLHALTVEKEEVMGMLIGHFDNENNAFIRATIALQRLDKRKDRVEISDEQMLAAMSKATELSDQLEEHEHVHVVGWYHSHPHITVEPSHVDLRTQGNYQMMDPRFIGLIFSVFNEDKTNKSQELQVTCFQSERGVKRPVPLIIEKKRIVEAPCLEAVINLSSSIVQEETDSYKAVRTPTQDAISRIHNDAKLVSSLCNIMRTTVNPVMLHLEHRVAMAEYQLQRLQREKVALMEQARSKRRSFHIVAKLE